jgi:hypothetical protein
MLNIRLVRSNGVVVSWMGIQVGMAWPMARQGTVELASSMDEAWMGLRARLLLALLRHARLDGGMALGSLVASPLLLSIPLLLLVVPILSGE